jgi:hypothetical protein
MEIRIQEIHDEKIAEVVSNEIVVTTVQDALDVMANAYHQGAANVVIHERNIIPDFFDLKTGLAGEILQKFSNYNMKLSIVGDFEKYKSRSLHAFILESNRGNRVFFVPDTQTAKQKLTERVQ